jgi:hypothetical protein
MSVGIDAGIGKYVKYVKRRADKRQKVFLISPTDRPASIIFCVCVRARVAK